LHILLILAGGYVLNLVLRRFIIKIVKLSVRPDLNESIEAEEKRENTLIRIFSWSSTIIILIVVIMMILQEVGVPIGPLLAGAGIAGLALGFGGQYLIRDFITGFFLILENQYRIGDIVHLDQTEGTVEDISLRMTTLRDLDGTVHHVPHGDIRRVSNLSKNYSRINLNIGVAYNVEIDKVIGVVNRVGMEMAQDPEWKDIILTPPQFLRVDDFADSAITIKILGETIPSRQWAATGELRHRIKKAFDQEGIEIPFPQRVIHNITSDKA
jgi:small conductance mechanosensitive channel